MTSNGSDRFASLHRNQWLTDQPLRANILLIHGLGEHSGRYNKFADYFNQRGIAVYAFDLPGHGETPGKRGHIPSFDDLNLAIQDMVVELQRRVSNSPLFLFGHSLGGLILLNYYFDKKPTHVQLIASAPALQNRLHIPPVKLAAARFLSVVLPSFQFPSELDANAISHDPTVVSAYKADPLVHGLASARLAVESIDAGKRILSEEKLVEVPLLLLQGTEDRLVNAQTNIDFARALQGDVTIKVWEGLYHEMHNEHEKDAVLAFIVAWMTKYI